MARHRSDSAGIALVIVLWGLAIVSALALGFSATTRTETVLARNQLERTQARYLADAGVHHAIRLLTDPGARTELCVDGTPLELPLGDSAVAIEIRDEGGRIDLNEVVPTLLASLFASAVENPVDARALTDAVLDWRDRDSERRPFGGERAEYARAGLDAGPRDGPFESVDELRLVKGVDAAVFARLAPSLTVFSHLRGIDAGVAAAATIAVLPGVEPAAAERYMAVRAAREDCTNREPLPPISGAERYLVKSHGLAYTVTAGVAMAEGAVFRRRAVVWLSLRPDRPYLILSWSEPGTVADGDAPPAP